MSSTIISNSASGSTGVKTEHFTYEWVIREFKLLPQDKGECIYSPIFRTVSNGAEWQLSLYPQGKNQSDGDYVSIFLQLHSHKTEPIKIKVHAEFSVLEDGITMPLVHTYQKEEACGFPKMIKRSVLLKSCGADDTITIRCKIVIPLKTITEASHTKKCMEQAFDCQRGQLSQAFRPLFKQPKFSDVVIIVGNKKFPAHKLVLAARSPVFSTMFEHKRSYKNDRNEVKIKRMDPAVVEAMLEFFYTDEVTNLEELAHGLLEASDRYDIQRLKSLCEKVLYESLDVKNSAKILIHADHNHSYKLKRHVMEFIVDNLSDVVETESYKEMKKNFPTLLDGLIRSMAVQQGSKRMKLS